MALGMHWFLPTGGDARDVVPRSDSFGVRPPTLHYLTQVALAAETAGFDALLTPCGTGCEDAWITTAHLIPRTSTCRFLVAFRPGLLSPTLAAQMASTYARMSGGRIAVNIVTGAEQRELGRFGDWADKDTRYARTDEFLEIMRGAMHTSPNTVTTASPEDGSPDAFRFEGEHYRVAGAMTREVPRPVPEIWFGGASPAAERVAARQADVYLAWGETPEMVAPRLERMRALAEDAGRQLRYGIRFHVIARPTAAEAWAEADRLQAAMDPAAIAAAQADFEATQSEGQRRMAQMHRAIDYSEGARSLELYPNLWAGVGLVRGGAGTALVGSFEQVAERIEEYADLGFSEFILSGYPHLEEAMWFGEGVMPLLRSRGHLPGADAEGSQIFHFR
jgi:alkanesulfonate monooxygenase